MYLYYACCQSPSSESGISGGSLQDCSPVGAKSSTGFHFPFTSQPARPGKSKHGELSTRKFVIISLVRLYARELSYLNRIKYRAIFLKDYFVDEKQWTKFRGLIWIPIRI